MKKIIISLTAAIGALALSFSAHANDDVLLPGAGTFNPSAGDCTVIGYSHYVGWEPYAYMASSEILGKHAREQGVCIEVQLINNYITSLENFSNGNLNGVTVTNMDLLSFQSSTGDTEVIKVGDYSNGNDAILVHNLDDADMSDLKGKDVGIVELSVNDYLLERCLDNASMSRKDLGQVVNFTDEADIAAQFTSDNNFAATVWNPVLLNLRSSIDTAATACDSSEIPGEIIDVLAVDANTPSAAKQAIVNAWYETMDHMKRRDATGTAARKVMANNANNTTAEYEAQLRTTAMFYSPTKAAEFIESSKFVDTANKVYKFTRTAGIVTDAQSIAVNGDAVITDAGDEPSINYVSTYTRNAANR